MAGFSPVGSAPVASVPAGGGVNYAAGKITITFQGLAPVVLGVSPIKVAVSLREVLRDASAPVRSTSVIRETLRDASAPVRSSAVVRETLRSGDSLGTNVRTASVVREVLVSTLSSTSDSGSICILW